MFRSSLFVFSVTCCTIILFGCAEASKDRIRVNPLVFLAHTPATVIQNVPIADVEIELIDNDDTPQLDDEIIVVASVDPDEKVTLVGTRAQMISGVASFPSLTLISCHDGPVYITFTAHDPNQNPVDNQAIIAGPLYIRAVPGTDVNFDVKSSITSVAAKVAVTVGYPISPIVLRIFDSCGEFDESDSGLQITASTSSNLLGGTLTVETLHGMATFRDLMFTGYASGSQGLTFTVDRNSGYTVAGKKIVTTKFLLQQQVIPRYNLRFREENSTITKEGMSVILYAFNTHSPAKIVIEIVDSLGRRDVNATGINVTVSTTHEVELPMTGNETSVINGTATFDNLVFHECNFMTFKLIFTAYLQGVHKSVTSGEVYLRGLPGQTIQPLIPFPTTGVLDENITLFIMMFDGCGERDVWTQGYEVRDRRGNASYVQQSGLVDYSMVTMWVVVPQGGIEFEFELCKVEDPIGKPCRRAPTLESSIAVHSVVRSIMMEFHPSYGMITNQNRTGIALHGVPQDIAVVVYNSDDTIDAENSATSLRITTDPPLMMTSDTATFTNGVAVFKDFAILQCSDVPVVLTFTAGDELDVPVKGTTLESGEITLIGVPASSLAFSSEDSYFTAAGEEGNATVGTPFPRITVYVLDSCGHVDDNNEALNGPIVAVVGPRLVNNTAKMMNGKAVFESLTLTNLPIGRKTVLVFYVVSFSEIPDLFTGEISVSPMNSTGSKEKLRFRFDSYLQEGVSADAIAEIPLFTAYIELVDSMGNVQHDDELEVWAVPSTDAVQLTGNVEIMLGGTATFYSLSVMTCYDEPFSILFFAGTQGDHPVASTYIETGSIRVFGQPMYAMHFARQSRVHKEVLHTAVVNTPIRTAVVQLLDSCGKVDDYAIGLLIQASTSNQELLGQNSSSVTDGKAIFQNLMFSVAGDIVGGITFTADPDAPFPVAGTSIVSGPFMVNDSAIPAVDLEFDFEVSGFTSEIEFMLVYAFRPLISYPVLRILDSAGVLDTTAFVEVTASSYEDPFIPIHGNTVISQNGIANFSSLQFMECTWYPIRMTFTAVLQNVSKSLTSGIVQVKGEPAITLVPTVTLPETHPVNTNVTMSFVTLDGCGALDTPDIGLDYELRYFNGSGVSPFINGQASIEVTVVEAGVNLVIDLCHVIDPPGYPCNRSTIVHTIAAHIVIPCAMLDFHLSRGMLHEVNQSVPVGHKGLHEIAVILLNSDGTVCTDGADISIAITFNQERALGLEVTPNVTNFTAEGLAVFSDLVFHSCPPEPVVLTFSTPWTTKEVKNFLLTSGEMEVIGSPAHHLAFDPFESFLVNSTQNETFYVGEFIPQIQVQVRDSCDRLDTSLPPGSVIIVNGSGALYDTIANVIEGEAIFDELMFHRLPTESNVHITFSSPSIPSYDLVTGNITVLKRVVVSKEKLKFRSDSYLQQNESSQIFVELAVPGVHVVVTDAAGVIQTDDELIVTVTTSTPDVVLRGNQALMSAGVATFNDLTVMNCYPYPFVLSFTAGSQGNHTVANKTLVTGDIMAQGIPGYDLKFDRTSLIDGRNFTATLNRPIGTVVVRLIDGCSTWDDTNNGLLINASSNIPGLKGLTSVYSKNGYAVFDDLMFSQFPSSTGSVVNITFTADPSSKLPVAGKYVTTGDIQIISDVEHLQGLKSVGSINVTNVTKSFVVYASAPISPPIVLEVLDSTGSTDVNITNASYTITATSEELPTLRILGNNASVINGTVTFSDLVIDNCTTIPFKLTFFAPFVVKGGAESLVSGRVEVHGIPAYQIQPSQPFPLTAVKNTNVTLQFEMLDSCMYVDSSSKGYEIRDATGNETYIRQRSPIVWGVVNVSIVVPAGGIDLVFELCAISDPIGVPCNRSIDRIEHHIEELAVSLPSYDMAFHPNQGIFNRDDHSRSLYHATAYDIVLLMLKSDDALDTNNSITTVTITTTSPIRFTPNTTTFVNGVAEFKDFQFLECVDFPVLLTFTAGLEGDFVVRNTTLLSGEVTILGKPYTSLQFSSTSALQPTGNATIVIAREYLPETTVNLLDTCGRICDRVPAAAEVVVNGTQYLFGTTSNIVGGTASFTTLSFHRVPPVWTVQLTFTAVVPHYPSVSLVSGVVIVLPEATAPPTDPPTDPPTPAPPTAKPTQTPSQAPMSPPPTVTPPPTTTTPSPPPPSTTTVPPTTNTPPATPVPTTSPPDTQAPTTNSPPTSTPSTTNIPPPTDTIAPPPSTDTTSPTTSPPNPTPTNTDTPPTTTETPTESPTSSPTSIPTSSPTPSLPPVTNAPTPPSSSVTPSTDGPITSPPPSPPPSTDVPSSTNPPTSTPTPAPTPSSVSPPPTETSTPSDTPTPTMTELTGTPIQTTTNNPSPSGPQTQAPPTTPAPIQRRHTRTHTVTQKVVLSLHLVSSEVAVVSNETSRIILKLSLEQRRWDDATLNKLKETLQFQVTSPTTKTNITAGNMNITADPADPTNRTVLITFFAPVNASAVTVEAGSSDFALAFAPELNLRGAPKEKAMSPTANPYHAITIASSLFIAFDTLCFAWSPNSMYFFQRVLMFSRMQFQDPSLSYFITGSGFILSPAHSVLGSMSVDDEADDGSRALWNVATLSVIAFVHSLVVIYNMRHHGVELMKAFSMARFPAVTLVAADYMWFGSVNSAVRCWTSPGHSSSWYIPVSLALILHPVAYVAYLMNYHLGGQHYTFTPDLSEGSRWRPVGFYNPREERNKHGHLFSSYHGKYTTWTFVRYIVNSVTATLSGYLGFPAFDGARKMWIALLVIEVLFAGVSLLVRPQRYPHQVLTDAARHIILAGMLAGFIANVSEGNSMSIPADSFIAPLALIMILNFGDNIASVVLSRWEEREAVKRLGGKKVRLNNAFAEEDEGEMVISPRSGLHTELADEMETLCTPLVEDDASGGNNPKSLDQLLPEKAMKSSLSKGDLRKAADGEGEGITVTLPPVAVAAAPTTPDPNDKAKSGNNKKFEAPFKAINLEDLGLDDDNDGETETPEESSKNNKKESGEGLF